MDRLSSVRRLLRPLETADPGYADRFLAKCDEISDAVSELTDDLQSRASAVELDESEFAALEERIQILQTLKRKYGPEIADVLTELDNSRRRLELFENSAREREQLAAWYQPVPEPVQEPVTKAPSVSVPPVDPTPAVAPVAEALSRLLRPQQRRHRSLAWQQGAHRVLR